MIIFTCWQKKAFWRCIMEEINESLHLQLLDFDKEKRTKWMKERKPFSVLFEVTPRCNMNCIHCYLQNNHIADEMQYERIIELIDILYEKGILFLTFTGGEIFTRKDFMSIYLYAKKKGFLVELFTNGYLISDEIIEVLKEYPPLLVDISLYGANEDTYYKITGIKGAFDRVVNNCKKLKDAGIRVSLKTPVLNETLGQISEMKDIAAQMDIPFVYTFEICSTIDKDDSPKRHQVRMVDILRHEFENHFEQVKNGGKNSLDRNDIIQELLNNDYVYRCNVALNSFIIDYNGNMCPCMKLRHKGERLTKENYDEIWERFGLYSKIIATEKYACKTCDAAYYCDICPAEMDYLYNDKEYRDKKMCRIALIRRDFYEKRITFEEALDRASFDE